MIPYPTRLVRSFRARPVRALTIAFLLAMIGFGLAAVGLNLWAGHQFREANRLVEQHRLTEAYAHYQQCLKVHRWSASTHFLAGRTARRAGLQSEAEEHLAACQKLQGTATGLAVPLALERLLMRAQFGNVSDVEEVLWGEIAKDKAETPLVLEALSRGYIRMFRLGTAMKCLDKLLERDPDNVEALLMRGWIREGGSDSPDAAKDYRRVLAIDPGRNDARLSLARILLHDSPEEARSQLELLIARQPDNSEASVKLAQAYRALGELDKARPILDALLAKDPGNSKGLAEMGAIRMAAGKTQEGEALYRKAIAADPGNIDAHYQLYLSLVQQPGREKEAAAQRDTHERVGADRDRLTQIATKEMSRAPNDPNLHYETGAIYLRNGKPDVGVRWLYSALKIDPGHQPSHQALYEHFKHVGDPDKAEQHRLELRARAASQPPKQRE